MTWMHTAGVNLGLPCSKPSKHASKPPPSWNRVRKRCCLLLYFECMDFRTFVLYGCSHKLNLNFFF